MEPLEEHFLERFVIDMQHEGFYEIVLALEELDFYPSQLDLGRGRDEG